MKRLVMMGPPASGKGTQGVRLSSALGIPHVSAGQLLRRSIEEGDPEGIGPLVEGGELVPDEITERLIHPVLSGGFILDGYPRTADQADGLDAHLAGEGETVDAVIELLVPDETLAARMVLRAGDQHRPDDTPEVFLHRLADYHFAVAPLREHYGGRLVDVDGTGSEDEVFDRLLAALERR